MQPKSLDRSPQTELYRSRLDQILNHRHSLFVLAHAIDWKVFDETFGALFTQKKGRPGLPTRLMVGLHYLKHLYSVSDEDAVGQFLENPYWQYFCGYEYFQHKLPLDRSSLTRWRKRMGADGIEKMLTETLEVATRSKLLKNNHLKKVNVDTTVQEKAIAFPTDSRLYHKMRKRLVKEAKARNIELRQNYNRLSKRALQKQGRYAHAKQMKRARRETKRLKTFLGRVIRDLKRKCLKGDQALVELLAFAQRLHDQQKKDSPKIYSVHASEVECISKGKAHKRYEFGCKASVVTTAKDHWIMAADAQHGNPYDGKTLKPSIDQMEKLTGKRPEHAFCDRGYRGSDHHPEDVEVILSGKKKLSQRLKRWMRKHSSIEPVIGHLKSDYRMNRNYLKGKEGDRMNVLLAACGWNLAKILLFAFFQSLFCYFRNQNDQQNQWAFARA